jgi:hypothetical protein
VHKHDSLIVELYSALRLFVNGLDAREWRCIGQNADEPPATGRMFVRFAEKRGLDKLNRCGVKFLYGNAKGVTVRIPYVFAVSSY